MNVKFSELGQITTDVAPVVNDSPLRHVDGQVVIVALTPAVERLARAARAIREGRKTLETGKAQVPGPQRAAR
jgi:hypothetical protein